MEVPRHWRMKQQRYAMTGSRCTHCGLVNFPARPVCPHCGGVMGKDRVLGRNQEPLGLPIRVDEPIVVTQRGG